MPLRRTSLRGLLLLLGGMLVTTPINGSAQGTASLAVAEDFRREPDGVILARLNSGASLQVVAVDDDWTQVFLEGWTWLRSLQVSDTGFDFRVSADGGENLRLEPAGRILGRLEEGALLDEIDRDPAWARVSRTGWVPSASLEGMESVAVQPSTSVESLPRAGAVSAAGVPGGFTNLGAAGGPILTAPDGDTLAVAAPSSDLQILRRQGGWARVRLEGWMWIPDGGATAASTGEAPAVSAIVPDDLAADLDGQAGRVVQWDLQFISLERAEAVRTDFFEGEPFLLTRYGGGDGPFIYVAIPAERLVEVEGLVPLERVVVTGRIRTAASALTGAPIIDLVSIERTGNDP